MIMMKYLHICGGNCNRSRKESRRSGRRLAESPVCRAGRLPPIYVDSLYK